MQTLTAETFFAGEADRVLLDVRSPGEYARGHAPGAVNLPLFSDAERAEVGTLYKQESPDAALLRGLEIAGGKMRQLVESARAAAPQGRVVVQCWRGGQRSGSVAWLLEKAGMDVRQLAGGYKAYRAFVRSWLATERHPLRVISGPTGSGKTRVLHALAAAGESIIDLEGLANHKGSSFGALGEAPQPTTESFENLLFAALRRIPPGRTVWVEDESRMIGIVCQPDAFYDRLVAAPVIELEQPEEWRVANLVRDYAGYQPEDLAAAFTRLRKRLGGQHLQAALKALEQQDFPTAARIALVYYDKTYAHYAARKGAGEVTRLTLQDPDPAVTARQILNLA
ncbi:tRNA 2-selenouridine synthase [Lewinella marina]|uniref:tRNA 2-selenouridine(34) synthase MnmH n=1 Tax=Neolewinella marina TaxID=438751 RepID=A0A2G0CHY9_9BACT|nr:tRNA 2-selenouridine(34) synthase MnmH [Neolewinella marina]NJB85295.1 tRNA 2-selenouridine synthase [Neolewinella marina]PHK99586.1 tRNA 2-selenouridine(34) synthase MnmH [Neolewinella marina]